MNESEFLPETNALPANVDYVECVVTGAGEIGLAIARDLAIAGRDVLLLERHAAR